MNVKLFNLMSSVEKTRFISWNLSGKCKCRLDKVDKVVLEY